jgi:hypothetical protein
MLIRKARKETLYYLASFLVAGLICQNQQIITGEYITDVYTRIYLGKTFLIVSVVTGLAVYLKKITAIRPRAIKILNLSIYLIIFIFMVYGILEQHNYYRHNYKTIQGYQNFAGAFRWLKANTSPRDVILTDPVDDHDWELWKLMILYTNNNFYLSLPSGSLISKEETEKRYLYAMRYFGYSLTDARGFFSKRPTFFVGLSASRAYNPDFDAALYTEELARKYELLFNKEPLGLLREFKVDLIFVKRPALRKGSTRYLNAVYQDNFVEIYALK